MSFTDIFIRRPVLSMVVSLVILVVGLKAFSLLPVRQYPETQNAVVTVSTRYFGASADTMAGFITTPLEAAIAKADGIDYITSSSSQGSSTIQATLRLNYDSNKALSQIFTLVNSVRNQLPADSQTPVITLSVGDPIKAMYIGFHSDVLPVNKMTDYILRVVKPLLQTIEGVQEVEIIGEKRFALRAWLNPDKLAAYGLTAADVSSALAANNYLSAVGTTRSDMVQVNLTASTNVQSPEAFRNLVIKEKDGRFVRLSDVAAVDLGSEDYDSMVVLNGQPGLAIGIGVAPAANLLDVANKVRDAFPGIIARLPKGIQAEIAYDASLYVDSSIKEVMYTLIEAVLIVVLVIFAFLGSPRAVLIPILTIPLSLVGTGILMLIFGFSINLLTLLSLVLAIGLVVDDAIIVVENITRHLEEGKKPLEAALMGGRELAGPIVAMTLVLIAVYLPIGFIGGLTGALFSEFAFTLVGAVTISAIVALTLSPMMTHRLLGARKRVPPHWERALIGRIDRIFDSLKRRYQRLLSATLSDMPTVLVFSAVVLGGIYALFVSAKHELAPQEDEGFLFTVISGAPTATLEQYALYQKQLYEKTKEFPEIFQVFQISSPFNSFSGAVLKPWDERKRDANTLQYMLQKRFDTVPGVRAATFLPPSLPGPGGFGFQFVVGGTASFEELYRVSQNVMEAAQKSGAFVYLDSDLKFDTPETTIEIDRDKLAGLGLTMRDVGGALSSMLGGGYVNYFSLSGRAYQVVPQVAQSFRVNASQLSDYHIRTASGASVPLSTVARLVTKTVPPQLNRFQQMNAATITAIPAPGVTTGDAINIVRGIGERLLPSGYRLDYAGQSRQFVKESSTLSATFAFAIVIIFLTLAGLFESFRDPVTILVSVPLSIFGALVFIALGVGHSSLNIYTQVGLITLVGLISKHGILIVRFANDLEAEGKSRREAVEIAAATRLRPILMTTAAMVLGVLPLILASGAGAVARINLGLVIGAGLAIGTVFTLFVVPAVHLMMGRKKSAAAS